MKESRTRDATLMLRVWQEPHDPRVRARLTCVPHRQAMTAVGVDEILAVVAKALRSFQEDADRTE